MDKNTLVRIASYAWFAFYLLVSWAPLLQVGATISALCYGGLMSVLILLTVFARSPKALLALMIAGFLYTLVVMWVYTIRDGRITIALPIISYYAAKVLGVSLAPILSRYFN